MFWNIAWQYGQGTSSPCSWVSCFPFAETDGQNSGCSVLRWWFSSCVLPRNWSHRRHRDAKYSQAARSIFMWCQFLDWTMASTLPPHSWLLMFSRSPSDRSVWPLTGASTFGANIRLARGLPVDTTSGAVGQQRSGPACSTWHPRWMCVWKDLHVVKVVLQYLHCGKPCCMKCAGLACNVLFILSWWTVVQCLLNVATFWAVKSHKLQRKTRSGHAGPKGAGSSVRSWPACNWVSRRCLSSCKCVQFRLWTMSLADTYNRRWVTDWIRQFTVSNNHASGGAIPCLWKACEKWMVLKNLPEHPMHVLLEPV